MHTIKAQDIMPGHIIMLDAHASLAVRQVRPFQSGDGTTSYQYLGEDGRQAWNCHNQNVVVKSMN